MEADASTPDAETAVLGSGTGGDTPPVGGPVLLDEPHVGSTIDRYVVLAVAGRGGMGQVLRAYDPKLQREVALKIVSERALDADSRDRMLREARAMAQLSHPHVVAVYDAEDTAAGVVLVMEYLDGQTLRRWSQATERSWLEVLTLLQAAGRGLAAAHAAGLLHRDFKPSNVLVAESGAVKVTDFGLAKLASAGHTHDSGESHERLSGASLDGSLTHAGTVVGTPRYMAPRAAPQRAADPGGRPVLVLRRALGIAVRRPAVSGQVRGGAGCSRPSRAVRPGGRPAGPPCPAR